VTQHPAASLANLLVEISLVAAEPAQTGTSRPTVCAAMLASISRIA